jgi:hypothetical protein
VTAHGSRASATRIARLGQDSSGVLAWRWSTAGWWRKIKISASLARWEWASSYQVSHRNRVVGTHKVTATRGILHGTRVDTSSCFDRSPRRDCRSLDRFTANC